MQAGPLQDLKPYICQCGILNCCTYEAWQTHWTQMAMSIMMLSACRAGSESFMHFTPWLPQGHACIHARDSSHWANKKCELARGCGVDGHKRPLLLAVCLGMLCRGSIDQFIWLPCLLLSAFAQIPHQTYSVQYFMKGL